MPLERVLQKRGLAFVRRLSQLYNGTGDDSHSLRPAVRVLQGAISNRQLSEDVPGSYKPAQGTLDRLSAAEVVLVTTTHEVNREFRDFCKQILGQSRVKFIVVGPPKVCVHLRNHEVRDTIVCRSSVPVQNHPPNLFYSSSLAHNIIRLRIVFQRSNLSETKVVCLL